MLVTLYVIFSRFVAYGLRSKLPLEKSWVADFLYEADTLLLCVGVGILFRPSNACGMGAGSMQNAHCYQPIDASFPIVEI